MQALDKRVGMLRLLLADLTARERQAQEAREQLRAQLTRIADFTVRFNTGISGALTAMQEVEEGIEQQERLLRHLALLRGRAQGELDALVVTRDVADAQARLAELEARRAQLLDAQTASQISADSSLASGTTASELHQIDAEIAELRAAIQAASEAAARALTANQRTQQQPQQRASAPPQE